MEPIQNKDLDLIVSCALNKVNKADHNKLKFVYGKLNYLCNKLKKKGYKIEIRQDPRKQAGKNGFVFQEYHWAKIYPKDFFENAKGKFAYIIGLSDTLHFHLKGIKGFESMNASIEASNNCWSVIEHIDKTYDDIVEDFLQFDKKYRNLFIKTGAGLGISYFGNILKEMEKDDKIKLVKYKKQIILQGPPGTGKTRLATEIAEEITSKNNKISIKDKIEYFFKNFKSFEEDALKKRPGIENELNLFRQKFPQDEIKDLSLEDYTLGQEDRDGFCYWLEYKLIHTGKYNGQARKFKIYYNQETDSYEKSKEFADKSDEETMKIVAERIQKVIDDPLKHGKNVKLGNGFVLKVLNTYKPDEFFPINSETILDQFLNAIGKDIKGKNYLQKNQEVQNYFMSQKNKYKIDATNYEFMHYLFNHDVLNEDANNTLDYSKDDDYKIVQFHPSYTYEDFVRGISVETKNTSVQYTVNNRVLAELANTAAINPENDYVLIIDEINRANLPSVFGELIYALEYRGKKVESMYKLKDKGRELILPPNMFIIGTMNTADRSVGHIDYAIRRRFAFVDVLPEDISGSLEDKYSFAIDEFHKVKSLFVKEGTAWEKSENLSNEFDPKDVCIGHSYFIYNKDDDENKRMKIDYEVKPILEEYLKDGVLKSIPKNFFIKLQES